jgi:hypothetical protein
VWGLDVVSPQTLVTRPTDITGTPIVNHCTQLCRVTHRHRHMYKLRHVRGHEHIRHVYMDMHWQGRGVHLYASVHVRKMQEGCARR